MTHLYYRLAALSVVLLLGGMIFLLSFSSLPALFVLGLGMVLGGLVLISFLAIQVQIGLGARFLEHNWTESG